LYIVRIGSDSWEGGATPQRILLLANGDPSTPAAACSAAGSGQPMIRHTPFVICPLLSSTAWVVGGVHSPEQHLNSRPSAKLLSETLNGLE